MSLPLADPQFWLVTAAALAALVYLLSRRLRFRRKGELQLPCENCSQAKPSGLAALARRLRGQGPSRPG